ncbi:MAG: A/G-specific adenine glycosylase [Methanobacteriota archaeon]|nr:MAG: A/G-specific adenine glycosylase [Euryarchaeota archaeon]
MEDALAERLLPWYREHRRDLSFRRTKDPYAILVSEVLLQRTRVVSGVPYFERFMARFPTVVDLANASEEQVLKAWEGLGFYGRARNLHRAGKAIVGDHSGQVPRTFAGLRELPGIGDYTAGAVASIAFGERVSAIDGNAARVLARVFRILGDLTRGEARKRLVGIGESLVPPSDPGAYNQALMELGATVCRPRTPLCTTCPLGSLCGAYRDGNPERYPQRFVRPPPPVIRVAFALVERKGKVLLVRRPSGGLLAGLWALPGGEIIGKTSAGAAIRESLKDLGVRGRVLGVSGRVDHTFSHRRWTGTVHRVRASGPTRLGGDALWAGPKEIQRLPLVPFHRRFLERGRGDDAAGTGTIRDLDMGEPF